MHSPEMIQQDMRDEIRNEVVVEYQGELRARFEQQLTDEMKAAIKKEVQEESRPCWHACEVE